MNFINSHIHASEVVYRAIVKGLYSFFSFFKILFF